MFLMRLLIEEWNVEININGGFGWMRFIDGNKISAKGSDFLIMLITFFNDNQSIKLRGTYALQLSHPKTHSVSTSRW